jgi:hypothetical protein
MAERLSMNGLAYPMFSPGLPGHLRDVLRTAAVEARAAKKGVWGVDRTYDGAVVDDIDSITDTAAGQVVLPELFRRLTDYLDSMTGSSLGTLRTVADGLHPLPSLRPNRRVAHGLATMVLGW